MSLLRDEWVRRSSRGLSNLGDRRSKQARADHRSRRAAGRRNGLRSIRPSAHGLRARFRPDGTHAVRCGAHASRSGRRYRRQVGVDDPIGIVGTVMRRNAGG
jgi:hypothetical protein